MTNLSVGEGFWSLHIDTLFFSILLGGLFCWWMRKMGQRALQHLENNEPPSFAVNVAEMIFDFVDGVVKDFFGTSRADIGSLAFTIFCWVLLWNVMDMVRMKPATRRSGFTVWRSWPTVSSRALTPSRAKYSHWIGTRT